ncbi:MAG TPA: hypothetical protein VKC63_04845 [Solirubrobacterales bacterium]|nr:hypothetical protein [Solirubrobacterales bacterium]
MEITAADALTRTSRLVNEQFFAGAAESTRIGAALPRLNVVVNCDAANAETENGQQVIINLALLVARMGIRVELDLPEVPLLRPRPPLCREGLVSALIELGRDLVPDAEIAARGAGYPCLEFVIGDTPYLSPGVAVRVCGDEWSLELSNANTDVGCRWGDGLPFGAFAAAGAGAAEALRAALGPLAKLVGAPLQVQPHRLEVGVSISCDLRDYFPELSAGVPELGRLDAVSGGAIVSNAVAVLRGADASSQLRVIESDVLEASNLNRYYYSRGREIMLPKTDHLISQSDESFKIEGMRLRLEAETLADVGALTDRVMVGVDHIPSRWLVQEAAPAWVGVGATQSLSTLVSSHRPAEPCAGCLHPRPLPADSEAATISFVSFWAGLLLAMELLCEVEGQRPAAQSIYCEPFGYNGPHLMRLDVAAQPQCPVRCLASRKRAA